MLFEVYILGHHGKYDQYLDDHTRSFFESFGTMYPDRKDFLAYVKDEKKLVHYVYIRRLAPKSGSKICPWIGFACVLNGLYCTNVSSLYGFFRSFVFEASDLGILSFVEKVKTKKKKKKEEPDAVSAGEDYMDFEFSTDACFADRESEMKSLKKRIVVDIESLEADFEKTGNYRVNLPEYALRLSDYAEDDPASVNQRYSRYQQEHNRVFFLGESRTATPVKRKSKQRRFIKFFVICCILGGLFCLAGFITYLIREKKDYAKSVGFYRKEKGLYCDSLQQMKQNFKEADSLFAIYQAYCSDLEFNEILTGAPVKDYNSTFDKSYWVWLYAKVPVRIKSFWVKAEKDGKVTIALYRKDGGESSRVDQCTVDVSEGRFVQVHPNFRLESSGRYYLCIESMSPDENGLLCHSASDVEYKRYNSGFLRITGFSSNGVIEYNRHSYYQYFYEIRYTLLVPQMAASYKISDSLVADYPDTRVRGKFLE